MSHVVQRFRLRSARIAERLEREPLDAQQQVDAACADIFDPYLNDNRKLDAVRLHLATLAGSTKLFPTADDIAQRRATAFHEAGHCVGADSLGVGVLGVTIDPSRIGEYLGYMRLAKSYETGGARTDLERLELERYCVIDLCGPAAEDEAGTPCSRESRERHHADVRRALLEIRPALSDAALRSLAEYLEHRARGLIRDNWPAVSALGELLLTRTTLNGSESRATIAAALDGPPIVTTPEPVHNPEDTAQ